MTPEEIQKEINKRDFTQPAGSKIFDFVLYVVRLHNEELEKLAVLNQYFDMARWIREAKP
jgi:hypothetical protein